MDEKADLSGTNGKLGSQTIAHDPWQVWWDRWETLKQAMIHLEGLIGAVRLVDAPPKQEGLVDENALAKREALLRRATLCVLIQELQKFVGAKDADQTNPNPDATAGLFVYLYNNLKSGRLTLPDRYPASYVFRILLDQIGFDTDIIASAAAQRLFAHDDLARRFHQADLLAQKAIQPAIDAGLLPTGTTAITFMANGARARVIPYAPVALIAIPFTAATVDQDLLATAHEAGHYVYWHGQFGSPTLTEKLVQAGVPKWCRDWAEEIFADVYGAVVAGAPYALSGQDILLDKLPEEFLKNDGEHPIAPLRPRLYGKVLSKRGGNNITWWAQLKERWLQEEAKVSQKATASSKAESGAPIKFRQRKHAIELEKQPLEEIMDLQNEGIADQPGVGDWPLDKALAVIYNALANVNSSKSVLQTAKPDGWWAGVDDVTQSTSSPEVHELYKGFSRYLNGLTGELPKEGLRYTLIEAKLRQVKERLLKGDRSVTQSQWEQLITWGGWVTRGPVDQPNPPRP